MDTRIINRVGLILCFFAGFMVAPELIGVERLKRLEEKLESLASRLFRNMELNKRVDEERQKRMKVIALSTLPIIGKSIIEEPTREEIFDQVIFFRSRNFSFLLFFFLVNGICSIAYNFPDSPFFATVYILVIFFLLYVFFKGLIDLFDAIKTYSHNLSALRKLVFCFYLFLFTPGLFYLISFSTFLEFQKFPYAIVMTELNFVSYILRKLTGEDRLRSIIVFWGVIFYILGNVMQIYCTF